MNTTCLKHRREFTSQPSTGDKERNATDEPREMQGDDTVLVEAGSKLILHWDVELVIHLFWNMFSS